MTPPQPLAAAHDLDDFHSSEPSLDEWLKHRAARNQISGASRTYVVSEGSAVIGYYCLAAGAVAHALAPSKLKRNRPDPIPVLVLGRLAVHASHQGRGLGTALLKDAILRTLEVSRTAGVSALLVHALSPAARDFYLSRGFVASPLQPMTLALPLSVVDATLRTMQH